MSEDIIRENSLRKFNADAETYEQTSDGKFCSRAYLAIIKKLNEQDGATLLDIGCGTGIILDQINGKKKLYGIDLSPNMIEQAKKRLGDKAELKIGDAEVLPWKSESFDTVCCTFSFHHCPCPEKVILEMNRVLKIGGYLILADPWLPSPLRELFNFFLRFSKDGDFHEYSKHELVQLLKRNNFEIQTYTHPTNDTFLLTACKK